MLGDVSFDFDRPNLHIKEVYRILRVWIDNFSETLEEGGNNMVINLKNYAENLNDFLEDIDSDKESDWRYKIVKACMDTILETLKEGGKEMTIKLESFVNNLKLLIIL